MPEEVLLTIFQHVGVEIVIASFAAQSGQFITDIMLKARTAPEYFICKRKEFFDLRWRAAG
jgi:hypothetical protein